MKIIRWKAVIPLAVLTTLTVVFCVFFMDSIIKNIFISSGEAIFGAKVEIRKLKTGIISPSIDIQGLQIADKGNFFKNAIEVDSIRFGMKFLPLLSKKVIIDDMSIENIRFGTERKTSGELPPKKIKKIEKKQKAEKKDGITSKLFDSLKAKMDQEASSMPIAKGTDGLGDSVKSFDAKKLVSGYDLESKKKLDSLSKDSAEKFQKYKTQLEGIKPEERVESTNLLIKEVSKIKIKTVQDVQPAKEKIDSLNKEKQLLDETLSKINASKDGISKELKEKGAVIGQIDDLVKKDRDNLMAMVNIGKIDKGGIARAVFGPIWMNRVNKGMYYLYLVRKYSPPKKKNQAKDLFPREKGYDVVFYKSEVLPGLLIKHIGISGKSEELDLEGTLVDLCSDQMAYGRPARLNITGKNGKNTYLIDGLFDHTGDIPVDSISIKADNMEVSSLGIPKNDYIPDIKSGTMVLISSFTLREEELDCRMLIEIKNVKFAKNKGNSEINNMLGEVFDSINSITVEARMYGKSDSLQTELDSNLDDMVSEKLKAAYEKKVAEYKAKINEELNNQVNKEKEKFALEYESKKEELTKGFTEKQNLVNEQKQAIEDKIQEVRKKIEDYTEGEKKKQEEEVKKKIGDKVPTKELDKYFK